MGVTDGRSLSNFIEGVLKKEIANKAVSIEEVELNSSYDCD